MEKEKYILEQIHADYVTKSRQAGISIIFVTLVFSFLHRVETQTSFILKIVCFLVMALSYVRFHNASRFIKKNIGLDQAVRNTTAIVIINGILWCVIGILATLAYEDLQVELLTTFILLNAFSSGSIVTLATHRSQLLIFNLLILTPQIFYAFWEVNRSGNKSFLWLIAYAVINFTYTYLQSKTISLELKNRFATQYELKKSLIEVEQNKKNLEEETIKTFHASRLSSLGEMASSVAHEINNPLTIIQAITKAILTTQKTNLEESVQVKLEKVYSASERIAKIVKGMKLISIKSDQNEHEVVSISKILELSLDLFEEKFIHEEIEFTCENSLNPMIACNPLQISQIVINLITNAIDALRNIEGKKTLKLIVAPNIAQGGVILRIINSGPLIKVEIVTKLFEPFFTTKHPGQGTGLGLSISKKLAENNGGDLIYEVYNGQVCFTLKLPQKKA